MLDILHYYKWSEVSVLISNDDYGVNFILDLQEVLITQDKSLHQAHLKQVRAGTNQIRKNWSLIG